MDFKDFDKKSAQEILQWTGSVSVSVPDWPPVFGMEDMVLIDMLAQLDDTVTVLTLDTGRLHEETYETMERVRSKYGICILNFFFQSGRMWNGSYGTRDISLSGKTSTTEKSVAPSANWNR